MASGTWVGSNDLDAVLVSLKLYHGLTRIFVVLYIPRCELRIAQSSTDTEIPDMNLIIFKIRGSAVQALGAQGLRTGFINMYARARPSLKENFYFIFFITYFFFQNRVNVLNMHSRIWVAGKF